MLKFAMTGGPGAGKTTLLAELERQGFQCVPENARDIIRERLAQGLSPRPEPDRFAREILDRDIQAYESLRGDQTPFFFDRSLFDALAMCVETGVVDYVDVQAYRTRYPLASVVFVLPPWAEIFEQDSERDQTYADAVNVYEGLRRWYEEIGFDCVVVPKLKVSDRADFVIKEVERYVSTHQ